MFSKRLGIYPIRFGNQLEFIQSGNPFFSKLESLIHNATDEIHFQMYIFDPDKTGEIILQALIDAAHRGVKIYVVLDAYGSKNLHHTWQKRFMDAGIELYFYSPIKFGNYLHMGMRMHHKIICIDKQFALLGGINVSDNYSCYSNQIPWLDFALLAHGKVVNDLWQVCRSTLKKVKQKKTNLFKPQTPEIVVEYKAIKVRVLQNNWLQAKIGITKQYKQQIRKAETQITLFASYFIPSLALKRLLKKAAKRGVQVNIVLGSISDVGLVKHASEYLYDDLLGSGINLYEWNKSVLHAKVATIDNHWVCVGSYNLNHLSDFGSIECNLEIEDEAFCTQTQTTLLQMIRDDCKKVSLKQFQKRTNPFLKIFNACCYGIMRLMLNMLFFLQSRNSKKIRYIKFD